MLQTHVTVTTIITVRRLYEPHDVALYKVNMQIKIKIREVNVDPKQMIPLSMLSTRNYFLANKHSD